MTGLEEGKDYNIEKVVIQHPIYNPEETKKKHPKHDQAYIYTIILNPGMEESKEQLPLVIVHGYGGSGMIFYKMFQDLRARFKVYLIDIYGMG